MARDNNLKIHLDGARIFNAAVSQKSSLSDIASYFDSISACLSKGLGAPVGTVLIGNNEFIKEARRWRKVLGGGMRQSGILAAAGIYALKNNVNRLSEDHSNAELLSDGLSSLKEIDVKSVNTNMIFISLAEDRRDDLIDYLRNNKVLVIGISPSMIRLVPIKAVYKMYIDFGCRALGII